MNKTLFILHLIKMNYIIIIDLILIVAALIGAFLIYYHKKNIEFGVSVIEDMDTNWQKTPISDIIEAKGYYPEVM